MEVSISYNMEHSYRNPNRTRMSGDTNGNSKLTESQVKEIWRLKDICNLAELSDRFSVSKQNIWYIKKQKSWKHVTEKI
jgi:hypothetical protein